MSIKIGNSNIQDIKMGNQSIIKVMLEETQVWPENTPLTHITSKFDTAGIAYGNKMYYATVFSSNFGENFTPASYNDPVWLEVTNVTALQGIDPIYTYLPPLSSGTGNRTFSNRFDFPLIPLIDANVDVSFWEGVSTDIEKIQVIKNKLDSIEITYYGLTNYTLYSSIGVDNGVNNGWLYLQSNDSSTHKILVDINYSNFTGYEFNDGILKYNVHGHLVNTSGHYLRSDYIQLDLYLRQ